MCAPAVFPSSWTRLRFAARIALDSQVASFLAVTDKCFDPTLMFVMAGAILVNLPVFQAIIRKKVWIMAWPSSAYLL